MLGDLPVEQSVPKRYTLNLKTAAALGITVPFDWMRWMRPTPVIAPGT